MTFHSDNGTSFVGERAYETFTGCSSSLYDIPSPDDLLSGKAESNVSVDVEGILFQVNDRLGQIPSTGNGSLY